MATPLLAKRPASPSFLEQAVLIVLIGGPLSGIWYFWDHHQPIHVEDPRLNLALYVGVFLVPLIWVALVFYKPVDYQSQDGETVLGASNYFSRWPMQWWMMFMMLATPLVAGVTFGHAFTKLLDHQEELSMSVTKAIVIFIVVGCLGAFYATLFLSRSEPATWISSGGLRTSILRFHQWNNIHHLSQRGELYAFYHRINPALPANVFKVRDREAQMLLERYLQEHGIPINNQEHPAYSKVKIVVVSGFLINIAACLWLRFALSISSLTTVLISFAIGIILTVVLEKYRGVSKYGKYIPIIEPKEETSNMII